MAEPVAGCRCLLARSARLAAAAADGHWDAWLEFVDPDSREVLRTGVETHQATEADLHHWATTLGDVYERGAFRRARVSRLATAVYREVTEGCVNPFDLITLGEHVLRRELRLFTCATLRVIVINHALNPAGLDLSRFTKAQLVTFIVTAVGAQQDRLRA